MSAAYSPPKKRPLRPGKQIDITEHHDGNHVCFIYDVLLLQDIHQLLLPEQVFENPFLFFINTTQTVYLGKQGLPSLVHSYLIALRSPHKPKLQPLYKLLVLFLLPFLSWLNFHVKTEWKWHPAALGWDIHIRLLTPRLGEHYGRKEQKDFRSPRG